MKNDWYDSYDPEHGDDRPCQCGHAYERHFDSYDQNRHVGCKYCDCATWRNEHGVPCYPTLLEIPVEIQVPRRSVDEVMGEINRYHVGREDLSIEDVSQDLRDATYSVMRGVQTTVRIAVHHTGAKLVIGR